jgi:hypothetical protein
VLLRLLCWRWLRRRRRLRLTRRLSAFTVAPRNFWHAFASPPPLPPSTLPSPPAAPTATATTARFVAPFGWLPVRIKVLVHGVTRTFGVVVVSKRTEQCAQFPTILVTRRWWWVPTTTTLGSVAAAPTGCRGRPER